MIYKGKISVWVVLFALSLLISWIGSWSLFKSDTEYQTYVKSKYGDIESSFSNASKKMQN